MPISPEMIPMAKPRAMAPKVGRVMGGFSVAVLRVVRQMRYCGVGIKRCW